MLQELINKEVAKLNQTRRFPGIGIAAALNNQQHIAVAGVRKFGGEQPVQSNDAWHIGSIGKSITATLIATLIEDGHFDFDTPFAAILPALACHSSWQRASIHQLLSHSSGLPANFPRQMSTQYPEAPLLPRARHDVLAKLLRQSSPRRPGKFRYSNIGYTLLGHIAETVCEVPFEQLIQQRVFAAQGWRSAGFGVPKRTAEQSPIWGHKSFLWRKKPMNPASNESDNTMIISPAGCMHMNLSDLVKHGQFHLDGARCSNPQFPARTWRQLHTPLIKDYACGWMTAKSETTGEPVLLHNGSNTLWYALLMLFPQSNLVLAFSANIGRMIVAEISFMNAASRICADLRHHKLI